MNVAKGFRRQGLSRSLLEAAVAYAAEHGAQIVEGYPTETERPTSGAFLFTGAASTFRQAGFVEAARRSPARPIMRRQL